jgi:protein-S-isoprenylcysteine O-methyltransferase Ste14
LPENIPLHFNLTGEADGFGSKQSILIIPIATLVMYLALTILERFPHKFNYMLEITAENAERQYRNMHYMMKILTVYIVLLFLYVTNMIVQIGSGNLRSMSNWILPVILVGLLSIVIIFIYRGYRLK